MLALRISESNGVLSTGPKPKCFGVPLSSESAHPSSVHHAWPVQVLKNQKFLCSDPHRWNSCKSLFLDRFRNSYSPDWLMAALHEVANEPWVPSKCRSFNLLKNEIEGDERIKWWLTLGYHPALACRSLSKGISAMLNNPRWSQALQFAFNIPAVPTIGIAWRNDLPTLQSVLRPFSKTLGRRTHMHE